MKIGLMDVDGHNFPNLPLMKLSAYHKAHGDKVEWWGGFNTYDIVYKSKVFDFTPNVDCPIKAEKVIEGGTGYGKKDKLPQEVEHIMPDYSIYPRFSEAYGFLTRGCPRNCKFCIVSQKEGSESKQVADLKEFWSGQKEIKLLDPNLLACRDHERLLQQLAASGSRIDFTQGLDIRMVSHDNAELLLHVNVENIHFAWDNPKQDLTWKFQQFKKFSRIDYRKLTVYVLTNFGSTTEEDLHRIYTLRDLGYSPYVMIFNKGEFVNEKARRMYPLQELLKKFTLEEIDHFKTCWHISRWANSPRIFKSVERFEDYNPRAKGGSHEIHSQ